MTDAIVCNTALRQRSVLSAFHRKITVILGLLGTFVLAGIWGFSSAKSATAYFEKVRLKNIFINPLPCPWWNWSLQDRATLLWSQRDESCVTKPSWVRHFRNMLFVLKCVLISCPTNCKWGVINTQNVHHKVRNAHCSVTITFSLHRLKRLSFPFSFNLPSAYPSIWAHRRQGFKTARSNNIADFSVTWTVC